MVVLFNSYDCFNNAFNNLTSYMNERFLCVFPGDIRDMLIPPFSGIILEFLIICELFLASK